MNECVGCDHCNCGDFDCYDNLLSIVKDIVYVMDMNLNIMPNSAIHHCAKELLKQLGEIK